MTDRFSTLPAFPQLKPRRRRLHLAVISALLSLPPLALLPDALPSAHAAKAVAPRNYDIPAGPLAGALLSFAQQAGIQLSVDAELTAGLNSKGLHGQHSIASALAALLGGTGLEAVHRGGNEYTLRKLPVQQGDTTLAPVTVTAGGERENAWGPVKGYVAKRSATATLTDTPLNEIPQSISVITAEQMQDRNVQNIQETLRYTAGVHADVYGLDNRGDWFNLRGGSQGSTLLDGMRSPDTGYGKIRDEPFAFERVEVLRGPASVIAGQNGPGGVINLVTKQPQAESQHEITAQIGNYNHRQLAVDFTGPINEDKTLLYRLVALTRTSDTQVEYADMKRQYLAPTLTWQPNADTHLSVYAQYQKDESQTTAGFLPVVGVLYPGPYGRISSERFVSEPDWDSYGGERLRFGYTLEQALNDAWTLRHRFRYDEVDGHYRSMFANYWEGLLADGRTINRTWVAHDRKSHITNSNLQLEGRLRSGIFSHTLLIGVDYMRQHGRIKAWSGSATPLDVYSPTYGTWTEPTLNDADAFSGTSKLDQKGLVLQDQLKINERWVLVGTVRHDQAETTSYQGTTQQDKATTKNLGLVYLADGGWSPYLGYSESFEPLIGTDRSGSAFKPTRGKQVEAGLKWQPAHLPITAAAAVYRLKETGRLTTDPADPNFSVQRGRVDVKGFELELAANLERWNLIANYTRTRATDKATGYRLNDVPQQSASLWAVRQLDDWGLTGVKAGLGVRHVGAIWNGDDTLKLDSVTLGDAMLSWSGGPWSLALNVTNLADKDYVATCSADNNCWYGTRRQVMLSMGYRW